jgi:hypothetical protein
LKQDADRRQRGNFVTVGRRAGCPSINRARSLTDGALDLQHPIPPSERRRLLGVRLAATHTWLCDRWACHVQPCPDEDLIDDFAQRLRRIDRHGPRCQELRDD